MVKVFLVEDESIIRRGIRDNIAWESHGFEFVGEAGDGEYAYPLLLNTKPDILITDIKMPFMDGLELSRLVKKSLPKTRIIILSGYNEFENRVLEYLSSSPMVTEDTLIIIEASKETDFDWLSDAGFHMIKEKVYKTNKHIFAGKGA